MAFEGNDRVPRPPELNIVLPKLQDILEKVHDWSSDEIKSERPTNILLITANDHEFIGCYKYMSPVKRGYHKSIGMVDFGQFGDQKRVALIKCAQGPMDTAIAVKNAAEILNPQVVLFVGICASMKPKKAKLGDVVISAKLATYDAKKVREDGTVEYRGVKANVSRNMAHLIRYAADGWRPPLKGSDNSEVELHRDAVMLSGSDLVNNRLRRDELGGYFRDALGLEMEGAGLYAAAYDLGIEWAVIKAVSDFADGSKQMTNDWQQFASVMAASVVYNIFKYPVVLKDWLRCKVNEFEVQPQQPVTPSNPVENITMIKYDVKSDQILQKGRSIDYVITERIDSSPLDRDNSGKVFYAKAIDVETETLVETKALFTENGALQAAIKKLFKELEKQGYIN